MSTKGEIAVFIFENWLYIVGMIFISIIFFYYFNKSNSYEDNAGYQKNDNQKKTIFLLHSN